MASSRIENFNAPSHKEINVIGITDYGVRIKGSDGHFDKTGPQAQPRVTRWDQRESSVEIAHQELPESTVQYISSNGTIFES